MFPCSWSSAARLKIVLKGGAGEIQVTLRFNPPLLKRGISKVEMSLAVFPRRLLPSISEGGMHFLQILWMKVIIMTRSRLKMNPFVRFHPCRAFQNFVFCRWIRTYLPRPWQKHLIIMFAYCFKCLFVHRRLRKGWCMIVPTRQWTWWNESQ